jgi:hypothetical protein
MDNGTIIKKLQKCLAKLIKHDKWLLEKDLNERSITHKLGQYLDIVFTDYDVDCEYNGDIDRGNGRKGIYVLRESLQRKGLLNDSEKINCDGELIERAVFPDVIIHERGSNTHNLCVIEAKKSTNRDTQEYDTIKLEHYTSSKNGNTLNYQLGIFVIIECSTERSSYTLKYFSGGSVLQ